MKIKTLKIQNFRSYREEAKVDFDDFTVLVGKNDVGKSTILEALDIFFNEGSGIIKIDKGDINVYELEQGNTDSIISVTFCELPKRILIDSSVETSLEEEYMLNSEGLLEVIKKYRNGGKPIITIMAHHPTRNECSNLLLKKNSELRKIIEDYGIQCDNKNVNSVMRQAIWKHFSDDLELQEIEVDVSKEDAKNIWDKLVLYMPLYSLFQADRSNSDNDSEVQDPLQEAVKQILGETEIQNKLSEVAQAVEDRLIDVSNRTLDKINEMDPSVASSLNPVIPTYDKLKWEGVFKSVAITGDNNIPINKRGSGIKRLILLNFFRAEAERRAIEGEGRNIIYAVEEPETAQHFDNQRKLVAALKDLVDTDTSQVILTTHSAVVVKEVSYDNIRIISLNKSEQVVSNVEQGILNTPTFNEINYLVYGEITEEYHDELYGMLSFYKLLPEYRRGKPTLDYTYIKNAESKEERRSYCLTDYVRHQIHHPENNRNPHYTKEQLAESIEEMRGFIKQKKLNASLIEPEDET